jgi:hypothetical protein
VNDRPYIDVIELRPISRVVVLKDAFELREDRPALWLQRVCLWVLRKLGCFACKETIDYQRHVFGDKGRDFMSRLWERKDALWGSFEREPTRLLIGAEQYAEMMRETASSAYFEFNAEYMKGGRHPKVMGLHVEVIPWMCGMLLL